MSAKTYLLTAPADAHDLLGRGLLCSDIVAKLQQINPNITMWQQYDAALWWPGKDWADTDWGVKTSLWIGPPGEEGSIKITAINAGAVPEHTQIGPDGKTIVKGWRQVLQKVIAAGAAPRDVLERAFGVTLVYDKVADLLCRACLKMGRRRKHNGGVLGLCKIHEQVMTAAREFLATQSGGPEAVQDHNAQVHRRLANVDVQVRGESLVGWTPEGK